MTFRNLLTVGAVLMTTAVLSTHAQTNLAKNGGFEDGKPDPFVTYGAAVLSVDNAEKFAGNASLHVDVTAQGANFWDSGLQYNTDVTFKGGTQYTWAAFMKAASARRINMKPELAQDPWTGYGEKQQDVTTEWKEYYVEFLPAAEVNPASLTMHIAEVAVPFWVDEVRWYEGNYTPGGQTTAVEPKGKLATSWASLKSR